MLLIKHGANNYTLRRFDTKHDQVTGRAEIEIAGNVKFQYDAIHGARVFSGSLLLSAAEINAYMQGRQ